MKKYILGTDWWTDCDDAVAMRIIARAHLCKEIEVLGIGMNACMEYSASSLDGFLKQEGVSDIPIGIDLEANDFGGNPPYQKNLVKYAERYLKNEDAEDAVSMYRRLLSDSSEKIEIIEIGYLQVLADVIESKPDEISFKSGIELISEKVSKIWIMAGKWDEVYGKENNFIRNERSRRAADIVCRKCPVPITFLGYEAGAGVITGGKLDKNDFLHQVICDHGSPNGRSSWDPMLVLLAIQGDEAKAGYDYVQGKASVNPDTGENTFTADANGLQRYVIKKEDDEYYQNMIDDLL